MSSAQSWQSRLDAHFSAEAGYWDTLYVRRDVRSEKFTRRLERALRAVDLHKLPADAAALEVGCGAGQATLELARRFRRVDAVDTAPWMIELTSRRVAAAGLDGAVRVRRGDVYELPYQEGSFDLVLGLGLMPWLQSPAAGLAELTRVLAPGGYLVISFDNRHRLPNLVDPLLSPWLAGIRAPVRRRLAAAHLDRWSSAAPGATRHSRSEMRTLAAAAGLQAISLEGIGFGPLTFLGRPFLPENAMLRGDRALQRVADSWRPLQALAVQHLLVARKPC
jgi:ubiquinone/menaquinone biosynthesis C-methylase UbiE